MVLEDCRSLSSRIGAPGKDGIRTVPSRWRTLREASATTGVGGFRDEVHED